MLDEERLWADLLSSMPMCFDLFGEAAGDPTRLRAAIDQLWPDHPGEPTELRSEITSCTPPRPRARMPLKKAAQKAPVSLSPT